jgi:hypothetical protein
VLTYREMMDRYADITGRRRRPVLDVPVLTPRINDAPLGFDDAVRAALGHA